MSVKIKLNDAARKNSNFYTNLDTIEGMIELNLTSSESISAIVVKVEGISKSTCYKDPGNGKTRSHVPIQEVHKVLFLTQSVFPDEGLIQSSRTASFTLQRGKHTWPFPFQIPVNNECREDQKKLGGLQNIINGTQVSGPLRHVQQILPPSMCDSEEVWVRYFVKVTVERPSLLSLNHRAYLPFVFLPIEPPRAEVTLANNAFFVKRLHTLSISHDTPKSKGILSLFADKPKTVADTISIELRTPNPPSITPGLPINIDLMGTFESNINVNHIALTRITMYLLATTRIRALYLKRALGSRTMCYKQDVNLVFQPPTQSNDGNSYAFHMSFLRDIPPVMIPSHVPPTFATCNISRLYELEVVLTISHLNQPGKKDLVSLTCPVSILSGVIAPPPQNVAGDNIASSSGLHDQTGSLAMGGSSNDGLEDLPSYTQVVRSGAPSSASRVHVTQHFASGRRTSYRVGEDYYHDPSRYDHA